MLASEEFQREARRKHGWLDIAGECGQESADPGDCILVVRTKQDSRAGEKDSGRLVGRKTEKQMAEAL